MDDSVASRSATAEQHPLQDVIRSISEMDVSNPNAFANLYQACATGKQTAAPSAIQPQIGHKQLTNITVLNTHRDGQVQRLNKRFSFWRMVGSGGKEKSSRSSMIAPASSSTNLLSPVWRPRQFQHARVRSAPEPISTTGTMDNKMNSWGTRNSQYTPYRFRYYARKSTRFEQNTRVDLNAKIVPEEEIPNIPRLTPSTPKGEWSPLGQDVPLIRVEKLDRWTLEKFLLRDFSCRGWY